MEMGVPAVVSDIPVFHEVGGDAALYFDPHTPQTFADAVKQLDEPAFRKKHIERGALHMQQFSWKASAEVLLDAIRSYRAPSI
jgi:glycosyltransferase involved in cell wall biosynthesis